VLPYQPDAVIAGVGDEHVAAAVHHHSGWIPQIRARAGPPVAAEARCTVPRHCRDDARACIHPPNAVIFVVGNEYVAAAVHGHSMWLV
jgi:hypothetical protein